MLRSLSYIYIYIYIFFSHNLDFNNILIYLYLVFIFTSARFGKLSSCVEANSLIAKICSQYRVTEFKVNLERYVRKEGPKSSC